MTQENRTEETSSTDESNDNELIRSLRAQLKEKEKELKSRPDRESLEAEVRTKLGRESALKEQLVALGHPGGLSELLLDRFEDDAEITSEGVVEVLQGIGFEAQTDDAVEQSEAAGNSAEKSDLAGVTDLSAKVRAAASGGVDPAEALSRKIAATSNQQELVEIMSEADLSGSAF